MRVGKFDHRRDYFGCRWPSETFNKAAEQILGVSLVSLWGSNWHQWHGKSPQQTLLADVFAAINETADSDKPVQVEYAAPDDARILLGKATICRKTTITAW